MQSGVELLVLLDTWYGSPEGNAVKHAAVAAVGVAVAAAVVAVEPAAVVDLAIRIPAEASYCPSSLAVWGTEALTSPAGDRWPYAVGS